jgi:hypothetical protein
MGFLIKLYFDKKSCRQVSKIILIFVLFLKLVFITEFISCVYFNKFKVLPTLGYYLYTSYHCPCNEWHVFM